MALSTNRDSDRFMLRLPDGMRGRIRAAAETNNRSMNAEIVATLEEKYPAPERWFDFEKWRAHRVHVEERSREIISEMEAITRSYAEARTRDEVDRLNKRFARLKAEHEELLAYSTNDDRFQSIIEAQEE